MSWLWKSALFAIPLLTVAWSCGQVCSGPENPVGPTLETGTYRDSRDTMALELNVEDGEATITYRDESDREVVEHWTFTPRGEPPE